MSYAELTVDQGSTFESTIDLVSDDGAVINVAGYVFTGQIRKSYYSTNPTANLTLSIVDAANGNVKVSITAANTANIKAGRYLYDIKMRDTSNTVTRLVEGVITITPQVTR
jgi:ribosomal protein S1